VFLEYYARNDIILLFHDDARSSFINGRIETLLVTMLFIIKFPLNYSYRLSKSDHYRRRYGISKLLLLFLGISPISTPCSSSYRTVLPATSSSCQPLKSLSMMSWSSSTTWCRLESPASEDILPSWSAIDVSAETG
jgi:hypothetical protein